MAYGFAIASTILYYLRGTKHIRPGGVRLFSLLGCCYPTCYYVTKHRDAADVLGAV